MDTILEQKGSYIDIFDQLLIGGLPTQYEKPLEKLFAKYDQSLYQFHLQ
jgi:hypothetical protein